MEIEFIKWLRDRLPNHPQMLVGPGDDAAILQFIRDKQCVITSDLLTDGVDFLLDQVGPRRVGRKSLAVNLSDLAAMAAKPLAVIVSLVLPRRGGLDLSKELYEGLLPLAAQHQVAIAGGDTNSWDGQLVVSITAIGEITENAAVLRSTAQVGDQIVVTGSFGGSILAKHLDFEPRVQEAINLNANYNLHAAIDVSDGLSLDLSRMAEASGVGAVIDVESVPIAAAAHQLAEQTPGVSAIEHALGDGEDFELILAVSKSEADRMIRDQPLGIPITRIGQFVEQRGLWSRSQDGSREPLTPRGYEHQLGS